MKFLLALMGAASLTVAGPAAAAEWTIDAAHAAAMFKVTHLGVSHVHGRFNTISGTVTTGDTAKDLKAVSVTIAADSVDSNHKKRDDHLKGPDFFDSAQHPTLTFVSTKVEAKGDTLMVTGNLTMRGVTKEITVPVTVVGEGKDPWGGTRAGYDATFSVKRDDFGIAFMPGGIGADVELSLALEVIKGK